MSTIKTIFKVLLGTVVIIVLSMSLIEVFNLSIYGIQVNKLCRTAAYQAAAMFTQETYNADGRNFVGTLSDIQGKDHYGNPYSYCSSNFFYDKNSSYLKVSNLSAPDADEQIFNAVFRDDDSEFYKLSRDCLGATASNITNNNNSQFYAYTNMKLLAMGTLNKGKKFTVPKLTFSSDYVKIQQNQDFTQANTYIDNRYTPANLGIPFIDKNVATNMFQYSLTKLLSGCDADNIWGPQKSTLLNLSGVNSVQTENGGTISQGLDIVGGYALPSVYFHGFRCYVSDSMQYPGLGSMALVSTSAKITDIEYKTYDLTKANQHSSGYNRLPGREEFEKDTGYSVLDRDPSVVRSPNKDLVAASKTGTKGLSWSASTRTMYTLKFSSGKSTNVVFNDSNLDNALITVATIEYAVPMKYVGVTPMSTVFNYIMGKSVVGLGTSGSTEGTGTTTYSYYKDEAMLDFSQAGNLYSGENFTGDGELNAYYKKDTVQFMLID